MPKSTQDFAELKKSLPRLGVGLGLRRSIAEETFAATDVIDWLEIVPENYMGKGGQALDHLWEAKDKGFPLISHGVDLSIGSVDPLSEPYLAALNEVFKEAQPAWFSDHLSFTRVNGAYFNDLIPLPFTKDALTHVVDRIKQVQQRIETPFLIENVSYYCAFADGEYSEAQFLTEVLEQSNCGLMLDVNNVYVNAKNHGYDPYEFIDSIPLERTVQIHIAGHLKENDFIIDTHGEAVCDEVYDLLRYTLKKVPVLGILLERDQNIPAFTELRDELVQIRQIVAETQPELLVNTSVNTGVAV